MTALREPQTAPTRPNPGRIAAGVILLLAGGVWLAVQLDWIDMDAAMVLPLSLTALGVALIALAWDRTTHVGLIVLGGVIALVTVVAAVSWPFPRTLAIGDRTVAPTSVADLEEQYDLAAGKMVIDLEDLRIEGTRTLDVNVGFGELDVTVPAGIRVEVEGSTFAGKVTLFGESGEGVGVSRDAEVGRLGDDTLILDLSVVAGEIRVEEGQRG